jgi:hypothetical protein
LSYNTVTVTMNQNVRHYTLTPVLWLPSPPRRRRTDF